MSPLRFRSGQIHLRKFRIESTTVVEPGTLVCLVADHIVPADSLATAAEVAASFAGVAHGRSEAGQTAAVSVDVSPLAVYEAAVDAAGYEVGDLLAVDLTATAGNTLAAAASPDEAIAMAAEFTDSATRLRLTFASTACTAANHSVSQVG